MTMEISGMRELSADLARASAEAAPRMSAVLNKAAVNITKTMKADFQGHRYFRRIAPTISYDVDETNAGATVEIGPDKDRRVNGKQPGPLAGIAYENPPSGYFGGSRGGATVRDPQAALDEEQPNLDRYLSEFARGVLDG